MTELLLVRHAAHEGCGTVLTGRAPGARLGPSGRLQARALGVRLAGLPIAAIYSSPRERAVETAEVVAAATKAPAPRLCEEADEVDFGSWTGRSFAALENEPDWRDWNARRGRARTPAGERMIGVQARMLHAMQAMARRHGKARIAIVSHAEVIRAALLFHLVLGLDDWRRIEIAPASVSRIAVDNDGARVLAINELA